MQSLLFQLLGDQGQRRYLHCMPFQGLSTLEYWYSGSAIWWEGGQWVAAGYTFFVKALRLTALQNTWQRVTSFQQRWEPSSSTLCAFVSKRGYEDRSISLTKISQIHWWMDSANTSMEICCRILQMIQQHQMPSSRWLITTVMEIAYHKGAKTMKIPTVVREWEGWLFALMLATCSEPGSCSLAEPLIA